MLDSVFVCAGDFFFVSFRAADNNKRAGLVFRGVHYNRVFDISARVFGAYITNDARGLVRRLARPSNPSEHII